MILKIKNVTLNKTWKKGYKIRLAAASLLLFNQITNNLKRIYTNRINL